ncbi:MAG: Galactose-1-phosphate uridylyltransferase [Calditrichaeota bacterium]|nr:Galactose-1-phosphate uridylyltransferase [Calditrichota bacterium]
MHAEMRHDPLQRRWVIIAPERGIRPTDFTTRDDEVEEFDPFAEGNEQHTTPEITAVRKPGTKPNTPGWTVRVIPNMYPAFRIEGELNRRGDGLYDSMNGVGAHEIVIETPERFQDIPQLPDEQLRTIGLVYRDRIIDLYRDRRIKYAILFRNHGRAAGASLSHPHTQIAAMTVTPLQIAMELNAARAHYHAKERCLLCDMLVQEKQQRVRLVQETEKFVAFCPYASRFNFETWILPRNHMYDFRKLPDEDVREFMLILRDVLDRMQGALKDPPYNFILVTAPNTETHDPRPAQWSTLELDWHWRVMILPRLGSLAGFEFGTGFHINSTPPEQAAELLRSVEV